MPVFIIILIIVLVAIGMVVSLFKNPMPPKLNTNATESDIESMLDLAHDYSVASMICAIVSIFFNPFTVVSMKALRLSAKAQMLSSQEQYSPYRIVAECIGTLTSIIWALGFFVIVYILMRNGGLI